MRDAGIYADVDIDAYHKEEGISSSGISLILDCPKRYHHEYVEKTKEQKNDAYMIGRAVHMLALEPKKYHESFYKMTETVDLRTKSGKEFYEKVCNEAGDKQILRPAEWELIEDIAHSIEQHAVWNKVGSGNVEHSIYWDGGIYNTRLRARPDFFNDNIIIDLKTTESISAFSRSVYQYGYHRQAAMQIDGLKNIDGKNRFFAFFVVEKKAPHLTACFQLDEQAIEQGRKEYLDGAVIYSECLKLNEWPGYEEKFQLLALPQWAQKLEGDENV